jgi:hypothetical protein
VAKIGDELDALISQITNGLVAAAPVEPAGTDVGDVISRTVPESAHSHLANEAEIFTPAIVVTALLHLVDSAPVRKHGVAVFNTS